MAVPVAEEIADAFRLLPATRGARQGARSLLALLRAAPRDSPMRTSLLSALEHYAHWRLDLFDLDAVLDVGRAMRGEDRNTVLRIVGRFVFATPRAFTPAHVRRVVAAFRGMPGLRYVLAELGGRPGARADTRALAGALCRRGHSLDAATELLGRDPFELLVVHNVDDGQGDEIVRVAPLLQALLDGNPALSATVLTRRTDLYDHPRVHTVSILDEAAVDAAFQRPFDGVVDFDEPAVPEVTDRPAMAARVDAYLGGWRSAFLAPRRPRFVVRAEKGDNRFGFREVLIDGRPSTRSLEPNAGGGAIVYEPVERLIVDLGLPQRAGEEAPLGRSALVGRASPDAEAAWRDLRARLGGPRRVALVNPFGRREPLEGFTREKSARLAVELTGLVDEGYAVVLLPNGEPWGGRETIRRVLAFLGHAPRARIAVARDPAEGDAGVVMRQVKHFAAYADLVVSVEGWMIHLAYALGRPFRMLLAPYSHAADWHPRGRSARQTLTAALSPAAAQATGDLLGARDPAPLPCYPRKSMLLAAVRGLGRLGGPEAKRVLVKVLASPDRHLRAEATAALGALLPGAGVEARLLAALRDDAAPVRAAAAEALLAAGVDCRRALGDGWRAHLVTHREAARQNWSDVLALGTAALPALAVAQRDVDDVIRREAAWSAAKILERYVPRKAGA